MTVKVYLHTAHGNKSCLEDICFHSIGGFSETKEFAHSWSKSFCLREPPILKGFAIQRSKQQVTIVVFSLLK